MKPPALNHSALASRRLTLATLAASAMGTGLSACGVASTLTKAEPAPTAVPTAVFDIVAVRNLNPDVNGQPKPILLKLYELRSGAAFERAGYLDLQDKDEAQLGADLVRRDELVISPGERRVVERKGNAEVRAFGLLAAFRDLERSTWRTVVDAPNSVELRRRWWGLGPTAALQPVRYLITLSRDSVQVQVQSNTR